MRRIMTSIFTSNWKARQPWGRLPNSNATFVTSLLFPRVSHCSLTPSSRLNCLWDMHTIPCGHFHPSLITWSILLTSQGLFCILQIHLCSAETPRLENLFSPHLSLSSQIQNHPLWHVLLRKGFPQNHRKCPKSKVYVLNHRVIFFSVISHYISEFCAFICTHVPAYTTSHGKVKWELMED